MRKGIIMSATGIKSVHLVYFSPSGSTEKIVRKIASAMPGPEVKTYNLLPSAARKKQYVFGKDDLVIYGSLSAGMLFTKAEELFACLQGNETPFIGVVSFGNAYYGVALTEMKERAEGRGFQVKGFSFNVNGIRRAVPDAGFTFYAGIRYFLCPELQRKIVGFFILLPESDNLIILFR